MRFSILIPSIDVKILKMCLYYLQRNSTKKHEVLVHINGIDKNEYKDLIPNPDDYDNIDLSITTSKQNLGISFPLNQLAKKATNDFIVYLNDDEFVLYGWDAHLSDAIKECGIDCPKMYTLRRIEEPEMNMNNPYYSGLSYSFLNSDGTLNEDKLTVDALMYRSISVNSPTIRKSVVPFCMLKYVYFELGGYDEDYYPGAGTDPDLGYKFIKKYGIKHLELVPSSLVYHMSKRRATHNFNDRTLIKPKANEYNLFYNKHKITMQEFDNMLTDFSTPINLIPQIIDVAFMMFNIVQNREEITWMAKEVKKIEPRHILEIGSERGGSMYIWDMIAQKGKRISVDMCDANTKTFRELAFKKMGTFNNITFIESNSHSKETYDRVVKELAGAKVDFLFLDGDHSYDGVKQDFEMYSPLVREGGLIGFHDVIESEQNKKTNTLVYKFWQELPASKRKEKIVGGKDIFGVGLYTK